MNDALRILFYFLQAMPPRKSRTTVNVNRVASEANDDSKACWDLLIPKNIDRITDSWNVNSRTTSRPRAVIYAWLKT